MREIENEIRELREKTGRTRKQFLVAELQTCMTAVEIGRLELSRGNTAIAEKEIAFTERGIQTIERFLPQITPAQRDGLESEIAGLKAALDSLKMKSASH